MPKPLLEGTLPSLQGSITITWRIYQPIQPRGNTGFIVAHPYAPLGGSFDDPVVALVVDALLEAGVVVGTFNFRYPMKSIAACLMRKSYRGVGGSNGSTSWTGKPELMDYISFSYFFIHYMLHFSNPSGVSKTPEDSGRNVLSIVFGGYSYGSMIAHQVPPAGDILKHFPTLAKSTEKAAEFLRTCEKEVARHHVNMPSGFGVNRLESMRIQTRYLLISPLLPPVTFLLAPVPSWLFGQWLPPVEEHRLAKCPTLAVFGATDGFSYGKRLRQWAERLKQREDSNFGYEEILDAGHFWREPGVASRLQDVVCRWARDIVVTAEDDRA